MEHVSTNVVISGDAIMAGSRPIFFANSGSVQPINLAITIVTTSESPITIAILGFLYMIRMRNPFAKASPIPTKMEIRASLNITLKMSLK